MAQQAIIFFLVAKISATKLTCSSCMPQISRSLARYHQELSAIDPGMDADTEFGLILRWRQHQDEAAKKALLEAHLRFVIKRAKRYAGTKQQLEEYIAAGNLGLLEALNRYDVNRVPRWRFLTRRSGLKT